MTTERDFVGFANEALASERYSSKNVLERRYHGKRMITLKNFLKDLLPQCESFLDVGCGTGEYLLFSKHYSPEISGLDISRRYLERCKPYKVSNLVLGDVRALPFKEHVFDCVLCSEVIEHLEEQEMVIPELLRVARKFVLLSTPNHGILRMFVSRLRNRLLAQIDARVGHVRVLKFPDLLQLVRDLRSKQWKIVSAFTIYVLPPLFDTTYLPIFITSLIDVLERFLTLLLPWLGNISVVYLERNEPLH